MASPGCGRPNCQSTDGDADADNGDGRPTWQSTDGDADADNGDGRATRQPLYCGGGADNGDGGDDGDGDGSVQIVLQDCNAVTFLLLSTSVHNCTGVTFE